jgi:mono/diheme cytochrome c family protein
MKNKFSSGRLFAAFLLLVGSTGLAQPWSVAVTNPPAQVRPAAPTWTNAVTITPPVAPPQRAAPPQLTSTPLPAGVLAFDAEQQECVLKPNEMTGSFVFNATNISPREVTVTFIQTSCGCTAANIQLPMKIGPGGNAQIPVNMDVRGKSGAITKTVTLHTDHGYKVLMVKSTIPAPAANAAGMALNRERNQQLALADRQAVFKGDCARCHVEPVIGKMGKDLYTFACGICHEAEHRATMVPDLHQLKVTPNAEYWKLFITQGKPATLMPAFAQVQGGPLSDAQINSLVDYLVKDFPATKTNAPAVTAH